MAKRLSRMPACLLAGYSSCCIGASKPPHTQQVCYSIPAHVSHLAIKSVVMLALPKLTSLFTVIQAS
eukprot:1143001-Pelagomonas_calceolata.AAC.1